jgi:hypothetical protein
MTPTLSVSVKTSGLAVRMLVMRFTQLLLGAMFML